MEEGKAWFVAWEEVVVSSDKGRRVVHYYLKDGVGGKQLAVVGREKSVRHMTYAVRNQFLRSMAGRPAASFSPSSSSAPAAVGRLKWKSRREVVDWLSSIVSDSVPCGSPVAERFSDYDAEPISIPTSKGVSSGKMGHHSKEFSWLGSAWNCRKRRKHYRSFYRNGITISVHDFVYIMAEEKKRLVAYVEDLYEDLRAKNMVVVRWFHKVDEVGIDLPSDVNDKEIFFSLCLQDFSIECIDGLAAVLSPQHFHKFQNESEEIVRSWKPYLCRRQIDNDDVKPFDITQVQGYWSQEVLRAMYATPETNLKLRLKITHGGSSHGLSGDKHYEPKKKKQRLNAHDTEPPGGDVHKSRNLGVVCSRAERHVSGVPSASHLLRKELLKHKLQQRQLQQHHLAPGCHVEVLSLDSGMRGCWFRCVILKRHCDKVKVRYQDVQDADDTGNLEEWILASRIASPDELGIRLDGRSVVRPDPPLQTNVSCSPDVGSVVDAWWHDGWWEGIVIRKELEGKFCVYLAGEQQVSVVSLGDLRYSQDWVGDKWNHIKDRPDVAISLLFKIDQGNRFGLTGDGHIPTQAATASGKIEAEPQERRLPACEPISNEEQVEKKKESIVSNLARVCQLDGLKWSSSRKRRRPREVGKRSSSSKRQCGKSSSSSSSQEDAEESNACGEFLVQVVENDNCKIGGGDPLLAAPMALCYNLVMSQ